MSYFEEYEKSIQKPESFWGEKAKSIDWSAFQKKYSQKIKMAFIIGLLMAR